MINKDLILGMLLGLGLTLIGMSLFTLYFSEAGLMESFSLLFEEGKLGALISLGALLNLPFFFYLLRTKQYKIANGMVGVLIILVGIVALLKAF
ncbi:MAG: hypothetical protein ACPHSE_03670 [Flavobacteriaceae bacterium]